MRRTKSAIALAALAVAIVSTAAAPAMADARPSRPTHAALLDRHTPVAGSFIAHDRHRP
ncbi:hypothetical protein [Streptomyces sp. NPDC058773]|uniref:hypothetical protein n=1 Tax=Streptomyces sp. NPDC058773 TaxID=3346632 RepID=UPI003681844F